MDLFIDPSGQITCLYGDEIPLNTLGILSIRRASHVEPDERGAWWADLAPSDGPKLGPFSTRTAALDAEVLWLTQQMLSRRNLSRH